ncbi:nicotinate-nicotinamide nucleotide adenylyltransferase [Thermoflexus sp.]|uniref:nicotinate-nicotinamide nucleotide adenylyltransferase n=1 Tax=Thermoflexus sp. TaxID=1969742 RepID=UPI002ADD9DD8|nr:nicotinate-nicotinamide nucleotide adenylyltransferase [Thermoflexus sp.]
MPNDRTPELEGLDPQAPPQWRWVHRARPGAQRIGVLSASFNPPTRAHIALMETAQESFRLEESVLLLAITHVEKPLTGFRLRERLEMLRAIAQGRPGWSVALCNRARFFEKARALREAVGERPELFFIIGGDTIVRLFDPRYYPDIPMESALEQFFQIARLLVAPRLPWDRPSLEAFLQDPSRETYRERIDFLSLDPALTELSSSQVRQRLARGEPVDAWIPPEILPWLAEPGGRLDRECSDG